eukprot:1150193-Pelagomonas_calceolata.AAC.2
MLETTIRLPRRTTYRWVRSAQPCSKCCVTSNQLVGLRRKGQAAKKAQGIELLRWNELQGGAFLGKDLAPPLVEDLYL